jgi:drug/metabolite transporter (DMT)-like permease
MRLDGRRSPERSRLIAAFAAIYLLWGSTYLAVALGLESLPPFLLMGVRSVAGGAILLDFAWWRGHLAGARAAWRGAAAAGVLLFAGCHGTLAYTQQYVPSGLAAVVLATIPFWIVLLTFVWRSGRRRGAATLVGLAPGIGGVALIAWRGAAPDGSPVDPVMVALLAGSALSWAAGSVVSQRQVGYAPASVVSGIELVCGGAVLLAASAASRELAGFSPAAVSAVSWGAMLYLTLAGSVVAFSAYVWLLDHAAAPLVATYTFVNPLIAVGLGWLVLGERLGPPMLAATALVIVSVVAVWRLERRSAADGEPVRTSGASRA